jgi:hypothetical protein
MYNEQNPARHYIALTLVWLLLGAALGLHFPDVDTRVQWLISSRLLLHRSAVTHGLIVPSLLFLSARAKGKAPSFRSFVIGFSLASAVHLCFDFFPRGWVGFALIHVPLYGRTTALFSQAWIMLSVLACLYLAFLLARRLIELAFGVGILVASFIVSAAENAGSVLNALALLIVAVGAVVTARRFRKAASGLTR